MKVLVVDDDPLIRSWLERALTQWGHEVVAVEDAKAVIEQMRGENAPRLLLIDWMLPGMNGVDLCRLIKNDGLRSFTYIILLTSKSEREDVVAGLAAGADDFIHKSVDPVVLRSRIEAGVRIINAFPPASWTKPQIDGYDVTEMLGKGGMGSVWKAKQEPTGREVAIKMIRIDLVNENMRTRFMREIDIMSSLEHPNIARVYDCGMTKELFYYVMELVKGATIDKYAKAYSPTRVQLVQIMAKVCEAVGYAHSKGVVHRDLKPSNVFVSPEGVPKVLDFGLAKSMVKDEPNAGSITQEGNVLGTPLYMSPEQALGQVQLVDARSDVYALGVMTYILLIGHHPAKLVANNKVDIIRSIQKGIVRPPKLFDPDFPSGLQAVLLKALAPTPDNRYPSAGSFGRDLNRALERINPDTFASKTGAKNNDSSASMNAIPGSTPPPSPAPSPLPKSKDVDLSEEKF